MMREFIAFGLGFTTGVIYTSNKYDKNPNEIFNAWGKSAVDAGNSVKGAVNDTAANVKQKFDEHIASKKNNAEVVNG